MFSLYCINFKSFIQHSCVVNSVCFISFQHVFVSVLLFLRFLQESKKSGPWRTDFWWSQKVSSRRGGTLVSPLSVYKIRLQYLKHHSVVRRRQTKNSSLFEFMSSRHYIRWEGNSTVNGWFFLPNGRFVSGKITTLLVVGSDAHSPSNIN